MRKWQALLLAVVTLGMINKVSGESLRKTPDLGLTPHPGLAPTPQMLQSTAWDPAGHHDTHGRDLAPIQCKRRTVHVIDLSNSQAGKRVGTVNALEQLEQRLDSEEICISVYATGSRDLGCGKTTAQKAALFAQAKALAQSGELETQTFIAGGIQGAISGIGRLSTQPGDVVNVIYEGDGVVRESQSTLRSLDASLTSACAQKGITCEKHGLAVQGTSPLRTTTFDILSPGNTHIFPGGVDQLTGEVNNIAICEPATETPSVPAATDTPSVQATGTPSTSPTPKPTDGGGPPPGAYVPPLVLAGLFALALLPRIVTKKKIVEVDNPEYLAYMAAQAAATTAPALATRTITETLHEGVREGTEWTRGATDVNRVTSKTTAKPGKLSAFSSSTSWREKVVGSNPNQIPPPNPLGAKPLHKERLATFSAPYAPPLHPGKRFTEGVPLTSLGSLPPEDIRDGQAPSHQAPPWRERSSTEEKQDDAPPPPPAKIAVVQLDSEFRGGFLSLPYALWAARKGLQATTERSELAPAAEEPADQQSRLAKIRARLAKVRERIANSWVASTRPAKFVHILVTGEADKGLYERVITRPATWAQSNLLPERAQQPVGKVFKGLESVGFGLAHIVGYIVLLPVAPFGRESAGPLGHKQRGITVKDKADRLKDPYLPAEERALLISLRDEDLLPAPKSWFQVVKETCVACVDKVRGNNTRPPSANTTPTGRPERDVDVEEVGDVELRGGDGTQLPQPPINPLFARVREELERARQSSEEGSGQAAPPLPPPRGPLPKPGRSGSGSDDL